MVAEDLAGAEESSEVFHSWTSRTNEPNFRLLAAKNIELEAFISNYSN